MQASTLLASPAALAAAITTLDVREQTYLARTKSYAHPPTSVAAKNHNQLHYYRSQDGKKLVVTHCGVSAVPDDSDDPQTSANTLIALAEQTARTLGCQDVTFAFGAVAGGRNPYPTQSAAILLSRGYTIHSVEAYMTIDLHSWTNSRATGLTTPRSTLTVQIATTPSQLSTKVFEIEAPAFDCTRDEMSAHYDALVSDGFANDAWVHAIGYPESTTTPAVAAALLIDTRTGLAMMFGLGTIPSARGEGLGAAMVEWCAREARRRGCSVLALTAQDDVERFYAKLGFAVFDRLTVYKFSTPSHVEK
ncbi:hypothetical protein HDU88_000496 [Geranomyces variabilis]|nr:hypothetical protein HDU88_000496 [Geranomyces variabilis]